MFFRKAYDKKKVKIGKETIKILIDIGGIKGKRAALVRHIWYNKVDGMYWEG